MIPFPEFTNSLLDWYCENGRDLPWRKTMDPYKIWISEIMLQQTQVPRVKDFFYPQFLERFPDVQTLSKATWEDVFPFWKGLGYYGRGKNLLRAAHIIMSQFHGAFPKTIEQLETLPGIGKYTARAILSFAFDEKLPAIDTNISKIISVLWPKEDVETIAKKLIESGNSGRDWNNAMMDLATLLRSGQSPTGNLRKFFPASVAGQFLAQKMKTLPTAIKKKRNYRIEVGAACIYRDGKYLIQSRPEGKSFVGFWEFPGGKREKGEDIRACVKREIMEELGIEISVRPHFVQDIHHFDKVDLVLRFHRCQIQRGEPKPLENQKLAWVSPKDFDSVEFLDTNHKAIEKLKKMRM